MRRLFVLSALLSCLSISPAVAQPVETVMLNTIIRILPGVQSAECYWFEAGTVTISARQVGDNQWPIDFSLVPDTGPVSGMLVFRINSTEVQSVTQRVAPGWRCYTLRHLGSTAQMAPAQWPRWEQAVEMRVTLTP